MKIKFLIVLLIAMLNASAQENLEISVKNEVGNKIAHVSLTIVDGQGEIVFRSTSSIDGYFKIVDIYSEEYSIEFSAPGYHNKRLAYDSLDRKGIYNVILEHKIVELQQVDILRDRSLMSVRGDTTVYHVEQKLGVENLRSLLTQLPGIEVRVDGKVYFKGKSVSKIYIDGDDLFGTNYSLALDRLKARLIAQVQAIENHNEIELYKGISDSNEVILDLNLVNPEVSDKFQDLGLYLAVAGQLGGAYNRMGIGKVKALTVIGLNEYSLSSRTDKIALDNKFQSLVGYYDFKLGSWKEEERFHLKDRKFHTTHNSLRSFGENLKLRTSVEIFKVTEFDEESISRNYLNLNGAQFYEQRGTKHSELDSRIKLQLFSKNSSEKYISFILAAGYTSAKNDIDIISQSKETGLDFLKRPLSVGLSFEYIKKIESNSILEFKNSYSREQLLEHSSMDGLHSSSYLLKNSMLANSINYIKKSGSFFNQLGVNQIFLNGGILVQDSSIVNRRFMQWILNYAPTFTFKKTELSAAISVNAMSVGEYNGQKWNSTAGRVFPSYLFSYKWLPDVRNQFGLSFAENIALYELEDINTSFVQSDSYIYKKGLGTDGFQTSQTFLASYLHTNLYNQFLAHLSLLHLKRINSLGTIYTMELNTVGFSKVVSPPLEALSLNLSLSKFIGLTNGVIKYGFLNSKNQYVNFGMSESFTKVNVSNQQHTISYKSAYTGFLNHFSSFESRKSESVNGNSTEFKSKIVLELKLSERILLGAEYLTLYGEAPTGKYTNSELRSTIHSKLGKSINLGIRIMNILNSREENRFAENHFERGFTKAVQIPRSMFLQLSYTIE